MSTTLSRRSLAGVQSCQSATVADRGGLRLAGGAAAEMLCSISPHAAIESMAEICQASRCFLVECQVKAQEPAARFVDQNSVLVYCWYG